MVWGPMTVTRSLDFTKYFISLVGILIDYLNQVLIAWSVVKYDYKHCLTILGKNKLFDFVVRLAKLLDETR